MVIRDLIVGPLQTNCYILINKGCGIIIDPGADSERIIGFISDLQIDLILLTHNHFDHIDGLVPVMDATSAEVAIHPSDMIDVAGKKLKDGEEILFGGERISVIHTPGHTPGSCCFYMKGHLFSGDTLFAGGWGNTVFPGGSEEAIFRSIRNKIMSLPDDTVVHPGHGQETTIGEERYLYF